VINNVTHLFSDKAIGTATYSAEQTTLGVWRGWLVC